MKTVEERLEALETVHAPAMILRDYFAASASDSDVQAWMHGEPCRQIKELPDGMRQEVYAPRLFTREQAKYRYADAMLKARNA